MIKRPSSLQLHLNYPSLNAKKGLLESPDLNMLGITSPELDNMVMNMDTEIIGQLQTLEKLDDNQINNNLDKQFSETLTNVTDFASSSFASINDEKLKLEKKRYNNRIAARKCQLKKKQQIIFLEKRIDELKLQNQFLLNHLNALRTDVNRLNQELLSHSNKGCVEVSQYLKYY